MTLLMRFVRWPLLSVFLLTLPGHAPPHPIHATVTQLDYQPADRQFEVSLRVFTDDLELALARAAKPAPGAPTDPLERYLAANFGLLDAKGQKLLMRYVGKEPEDDATWVYLEIPFSGPLVGLRVQNAVLTEIYSDQTNLVNLTYLTTKRTYLLKPGQATQAIP